ncbi:aspartyl protease family protein [Candidatus Neomarinimicrobiota bacterium]
MRTITPITLFLGLFISAGTATAPDNPAPETGTSIPFFLQANKIILPARVNNSRELHLILDTGMAFDGVLIYKPQLTDSLALADTYHVQVGGAGSGGLNMAVMTDSANLQVGGLTLPGQAVLVLQDDKLADFPRDGVIGYSFFGHYAVEIDYHRMVIDLHDPGQFELDSAWHPLPIFFKENRIPWLQVGVNVNGEADIPMSVYVDLASGESLALLIHDDMSWVLPEGLEEYYLGRGLSGDIHGYRGTIEALSLGPYTLTGLTAAFAPREVRSKQPGADAVLGNGVLRRFNLVFDYAGKRLYMQPNRQFGSPP